MDAPLQAFDVVAQIIHTGHCIMFLLKKLLSLRLWQAREMACQRLGQAPAYSGVPVRQERWKRLYLICYVDINSYIVHLLIL
jgi:hypothetical protein